MEAFDALPLEIRRVLIASDYKFDCEELLSAWRALGTRSVLNAIANAEVHYARHAS